MVTGEWTAGAVRPMHPWRQSDDQQLCPRIAEGRHRPRVVVRMGTFDLVEKIGKPWACAAIRSKLHAARLLRAVERQLAVLHADGAYHGDRIEISLAALQLCD